MLMEEKPRLANTPFPLQTIFGERSVDQGVTGKAVRRVPVRSKFSMSSEPSTTNKQETAPNKLQQRRFSRKIIRDQHLPSRIPQQVQLYKTFTGPNGFFGAESQRNSKLDCFVSAETISSSQGFLHAVLFQPRVSTIDRELISISVEGVLADYVDREVQIRSEAVSLLKELHLRYQVVLISGWRLARLLKMLSYLSSKGVYISGAYKQVSQGRGISEEFEKKRHEWYFDYSRIYKDFNISGENAKRVFCMVPLLAAPEELTEPHFVAEYTGALRPVFFVSKCPVPTAQHPFSPVTLLVPHVRQSPVNLAQIADVVKALATQKNFYQAVHNLKNSQFQLVVTNVLNKEILALYHKKSESEVPIGTFLIFKSGVMTDVITLHREKEIRTFEFENLLEFTLNLDR
jgi:hypothetical protein